MSQNNYFKTLLIYYELIYLLDVLRFVNTFLTLTNLLPYRYQLLLVLSKEMVAKWQNITEDHKNFNHKLAELKSWLDTLENKTTQILNDDALDLKTKLSLLQNLYGNSDQTVAKMSLLTNLGESLYPDTSAAGREIIRQQLKDIRERYLFEINKYF